MLPTGRVPTHPGEILAEEFLRPLGITQVQFAKHLGIPLQRVNEIILAKRGVTPETALLFSSALRTTPEFWINLQSACDLVRARDGMPFFPVAITTQRTRGAVRADRSSRAYHPAVSRSRVAARKAK
jgi:antitoxin HigA-1